jgi:PmbA protein
MIERALEIGQKRAQAAEVTLVRGRSTEAEYEDDRLKRLGVAQTTHLGVRVIVDGKLGSAHTTDPNALQDVVGRAVELAEFGSDAHFEFPGPADCPDVETHDPDVETTPKQDLVAAGSEMLDIVKAYNDEIKVFGGASWYSQERQLLNSSGLAVRDRRSGYDVHIGGVLVRDTDMLFVSHGRTWRRPVVPPKALADRAVEQFRLAESTAPLTSRSMPVILTPRGCALLLYCIQLGVNGKNVLKGDSPLAGRLGETIATPALSLVDDPIIDWAPQSGGCDGEGVPRRRTEIIADGRLGSFLYDLETAGRANAASTGHGPGCGPTNLVIPPGDVPTSDMIESTKEGLLVEHVMGLGQSNLINGDFSVNVSLGYKIENGEIVGRVKDAMLAGNVYDALQRIEAIGSEPEWAYSAHAPHIKIAALSVVAKA